MWTGTEVIVWGGNYTVCEPCTSNPRNDGALYDPALDRWTAMSATGAPEPRHSHGAVWTGSEMVIYGGWVPPEDEAGNQRLASGGGAYSPESDTWRSISAEGAPEPQNLPFVLWTGTEMIVWDGRRIEPPRPGARYDAASDQWTPISAFEEDVLTSGVVWADDALLAIASSGSFTGRQYARYELANDRWVAHPVEVNLWCRTPLWTGRRLLLWDPVAATAFEVDLAADLIQPMPRDGEPSLRTDHVAVWTGAELLVWGGEDEASHDPVNTGGLYRPLD